MIINLARSMAAGGFRFFSKQRALWRMQAEERG
jgi:hypothetical protein